MRVLICGSRDFADKDVLGQVMGGLLGVPGITDSEFYPTIVIDGECLYDGADELGHQWALAWGLPTERFPSAARTAAAYHARDRAMVDSKPDLVVAFVNKPFAESRGTKYPVDYARSKGIRTVVVEVIPSE